MKKLTTFAAALTLLATLCVAGERGPGKYAGVVIFDRWGGCTLFSGVYLMYISDCVKEQLRPEAGKCVQIDATQVEQPMNPGDGLIRKFNVLGPAPSAKEWESPEGLTIAVACAFEDGNAPEFIIRVENVGDKPRTLHMNSLAPTLLAAKTKGGDRWSPSDGPSTAVVTRQSFWIGSTDGPRIRGANETWRWKVVAPQKVEEDVPLDPKAVFELRLAFKLPAGEYEFLAGYGGGVHDGQCIASNLIGFDVEQDGTAVLAKAAAGNKGEVATLVTYSLAQLESVGAVDADDRPAPATHPESIPADLDIVNRLRDALKNGTPAEKEAALHMIRDLKAIKLIPEVIEAIEDPTPLPDHISRDCITGWVFVGHQAATVMGEIARDIDGVAIGTKPGDRPYQSYSFHNDLDQGAKLKAAGRLSEVRKNWAKWWDAARK